MGKLNDPDLSPSPELAYIIGSVLGDGSVIEQKEKGSYFIVLTTTSREFASSFAEALRKIGIKPVLRQMKTDRPSHWGNKPVIYVRGYSKRLLLFFKSLTYSKLQEILGKRKHIVTFLRGFYEAEGSLKKRGDMSISNSNRALLMLVGGLMGEIGVPVNVTGPYLWKTNRKPMFLIQAGKAKARKFLQLVKPSIKCGVDD